MNRFSFTNIVLLYLKHPTSTYSQVPALARKRAQCDDSRSDFHIHYELFAAGAGLVGLGFGFRTDPLLLVRALVVLLNVEGLVIVIRNVIVER